MPTTVAFIGLGVMGSPMAVNLVRAGFTVAGYNRTRTKTQALVDAGGTAADSIADAVSDADVVATMLPASADVEGVLLHDDGVLGSARPGTLLIDFSTIEPDVARTLAAEADSAGMSMLDAPVSGGEEGAKNGQLSLMVGGTERDFTRASDLFRALGRTMVHVGPAGAGQVVKAANQLIVAGHIQLLAEALILLEAAGVDPDAALDAIGGGLAGSRVLEQKRGNMTSRSFTPGFRIDLHDKDLGITCATARSEDVVLPLTAHLAQLMRTARLVGDGSLDHSALLRGVERASGIAR